MTPVAPVAPLQPPVTQATSLANSLCRSQNELSETFTSVGKFPAQKLKN